MKTLHVLRSEPDEMVRTLIEEVSLGGDSLEVPLYLGDVNYDELVAAIFESDQVISWW